MMQNDFISPKSQETTYELLPRQRQHKEPRLCSEQKPSSTVCLIILAFKLSLSLGFRWTGLLIHSHSPKNTGNNWRMYCTCVKCPSCRDRKIIQSTDSNQGKPTTGPHHPLLICQLTPQATPHNWHWFFHVSARKMMKCLIQIHIIPYNRYSSSMVIVRVPRTENLNTIRLNYTMQHQHDHY